MNIENNLIKYFKQENTLPEKIRVKIFERLNTDEKIELYANFDLGENYKIQSNWIILTKRLVFLAFENKNTNFIIKNFEILKVARIVEYSSISSNTIVFIEADDMPPLATIRYTRRQSIGIGTIKYVLEERIKNKDYELMNIKNADEEYQKAVLKPVLDVQGDIAHKKASVLFRLLKYLLPYKKELIIGTIGAVMTTLVSMVPAYISGYLVDFVVKPFQDGKLDYLEAMKLGWILVGTYALVMICREFFLWLRLYRMSVLGELVARDLRDELYSHIHSLGMDFFSKKQTGSIISRVSSDTDRIWDFIAFGVIEVFISIITLITLGGVLIWLDFRLGLVMTLPVPVLLYMIFRHGEKMKMLFIKAWRKWSDLTNVLSDTIPGMQVVKAFSQQSRERKRFSQKNKSVTDEFENIHKSWTKFWPLLMLSIHTVMFSVWAFAIPRLISNTGDESYLTAGTFVSFLLYMTMFSTPIEVIGQVARMLNRALSSAYRIFEILDTKSTIKISDNAKSIEKIKGAIDFEDVIFSYDGIRNVIKGMNFKVNEGEMIGLVGESGGGKTTITKLLSRFYDSSSGRILIDGVDIKELNLEEFRKHVGVVMQDSYLFHGTILDNIVYGRPSASLIDVIEASKMANAHEFIGRLPYGYDTIVGERGHTLSGGERQRISIARAVLTNPQILILDEATSAVDTETERKIQEALDRLIEGRTVFAVAHRLSTLRKANRIFVIENGQILEKGTHKELLGKKDGKYCKLHKMQQEMSEYFAV